MYALRIRGLCCSSMEKSKHQRCLSPETVLALMCPTIVSNIVNSVMSKRYNQGMYKSLNVLPLECGGVKSVFVAILAEVHSLQGLKIAAVEALVRILNSIACPVCAALSAWRLSKRCATSTRQDGCIGRCLPLSASPRMRKTST